MNALVQGLFGIILIIVAVLLYWINNDQRKMTEVEELVSRDEVLATKKKNPLYHRLNIFATIITLIGAMLMLCSLV